MMLIDYKFEWRMEVIIYIIVWTQQSSDLNWANGCRGEYF